jgi:hypothetical protein
MERTVITECFLFTCVLTSITDDGFLTPQEAQIISRIVTRGVIIGVVGLLLLLSAYLKPFRKFQQFILPKLIIIAPIVLGFVISLFIGFVISFGNCYKQSCSDFEQYAGITFPILSLFITAPITKVLYKKKGRLAEKIEKSGNLGWAISGIFLILYAIWSTVHRLGYI